MSKNKIEISEWQFRVRAASEALNLPAEDLADKLKEFFGAATVDSLDKVGFKFGDFRAAFEATPMIPLREAFRYLKGGKDSEAEASPRIKQLQAMGFDPKLEDADTMELLKSYLPDKPSDPITQVLKKRFGDKPIIAFREDGKVALDESCQYVADLEQGYPSTSAIMVDGNLSKLYPVGTRPGGLVDEDPLFPGSPLRNSCSVVNNRNWSRVSLEARQLCRIIVRRGDIDVNNKDAVLRLLERATTDNAVGMPVALTDAYGEAHMEFRELKKRDELPKLRILLGEVSRQNNPFGVPRRY